MKNRDYNTTEPFSWTAFSKSPSPDPSSLPAAPTSWLPAQDMKLFGESPLTSTSEIGLVRCKDCQKPVLRSSMVDHVTTCALTRKKRAELDGITRVLSTACPALILGTQLPISVNHPQI